MDKIKVSKEVAHALEVALKTCSKAKFFEQHSNKMQWSLDVYLPLNQISNWEMAQILINGYEVEETPEEKLVNIYKTLISSENYAKINQQGFYDRGFVDGVKYVLQNENRKIKGIND